MNRYLLRNAVTFILFAVIVAFFASSSDSFLTRNNLISMSREAAFTGIIAVGATFVIITGGIDLSVGSAMAVAAMVCSNILRFTSMPIPIAIAAALLTGLACGLFNGLIITKLKLPDFIVVLASMGIFRGITKLMAATDLASMGKNSMIVNPAFKLLAGRFHNLYYVVIAFIIITVIGQFVLRRTRLRLYTYAVGSNLQSATFSGIKAARIKVFAYALTGLLCGVSGVFTAARLMTATTETGMGMEFNVIAAVVIGGASLTGGRGDIIGTFIGTLMMACINSGTVQIGVPTFYQPIIKGGIILAAVFFDMWYVSRIGRPAIRAETVRA
ncbi:MAG: ABC transporter permease [Planctomycetes bacterium]|nr:ABC transporter permease [Planctomycetota bacterium]